MSTLVTAYSEEFLDQLFHDRLGSMGDPPSLVTRSNRLLPPMFVLWNPLVYLGGEFLIVWSSIHCAVDLLDDHNSLEVRGSVLAHTRGGYSTKVGHATPKM